MSNHSKNCETIQNLKYKQNKLCFLIMNHSLKLLVHYTKSSLMKQQRNKRRCRVSAFTNELTTSGNRKLEMVSIFAFHYWIIGYY